MQAIRFLVSGRVQGVAFRYFTERQAKALGLKGYVRNLETGQVEVVAQGDNQQLDKLATWLAKGPPSAKVQQVEQVLLEDLALFDDFSIRY